MDLPSPDLPSAGPSRRRLPKPPDERFWKRYSRHHELPLSVASSFFLHIAGYGLLGLILTGTLLSFLGFNQEEPLSVEPIQVAAGGSGIEEGIGAGPANGDIPLRRESLKDNPSVKTAEKDILPIDAPPLHDPSEVLENSRLIELPKTSLDLQAGADQRLRNQINHVLAGKGKGGHGSAGGEGRGQGGGAGNATGPGVSNTKLNQRQKRLLRWAMVFNKRDGEDYLRQLHLLGAFIAVPTRDGQHTVFRNLAHPPLHGKIEDIEQINLIHWTDDRPDSVRSLASAMGLQDMPESIIAFFPLELERSLREKERQAYAGDEENIRETTFRVVNRGGHYEPIVSSIDHGS
jgi:hypothetical protein